MMNHVPLPDSSSPRAPAAPCDVERALTRVVDPCSIATGVPIGLPNMGLVKGIDVDGGHVTVTLRLTSPACFQVGIILKAAERAVGELPGVTEVTCRIDYEQDWTPDMMAQSSRDELRRVRPLRSRRPIAPTHRASEQ